MSFRRPQDGLFPGTAAQVQGSVQGVDSEAVCVGLSSGRLGAGVAVQAVGHPLHPAARDIFPGWDSPRYPVRDGQVPDKPVGKALDGVAHVLQDDGQGFSLRGQSIQNQFRGQVPPPAGVVREEFDVLDAGATYF